MAFTASTIWEVQTGGDDTNNGGGFDTSATFPTDGAATVATGDSPVFTSASYNFVAGDVGAWIYIKAGTNWLFGWYKITSVAANAATLDAGIGEGVDQYHRPALVVGCATTASPTGATWGIDYSQGGTSRITFTDMVIGATTTQFTSVLNPVGKNFIGNTIKITSGTGFTVQRVYVVSTSTITATCDKSIGTGGSVGGNGRLGGSLLSVGQAASHVVAFGAIYIKSGSYTITSASTNVAGGCVTLSGLNDNKIIGYGTVRGDMGTAPVLTASGISTFTMFTALPSDTWIYNLTLDGAGLTSGRGIKADAGRNIFYKLWGKNFTNSAFYSFNTSDQTYVMCRASGCTTLSAFLARRMFGCQAYDNTGGGFGSAGGLSLVVDCIAYGNTGDGFNCSILDVFINCTSYANSGDGFDVSKSTLINCISEGNTGYGFRVSTGPSQLNHCAAYTNTAGDILYTAGVFTMTEGFVTGTGSFFTNAAADDFSLNNTAGAGAAVRAVGLPGTYPDGLSIAYLDMGAVQHADPASSGGIAHMAGAGGGFAG